MGIFKFKKVASEAEVQKVSNRLTEEIEKAHQDDVDRQISLGIGVKNLIEQCKLYMGSRTGFGMGPTTREATKILGGLESKDIDVIMNTLSALSGNKFASSMTSFVNKCDKPNRIEGKRRLLVADDDTLMTKTQKEKYDQEFSGRYTKLPVEGFELKDGTKITLDWLKDHSSWLKEFGDSAYAEGVDTLYIRKDVLEEIKKSV